jgi:hypothetical protein
MLDSSLQVLRHFNGDSHQASGKACKRQLQENPGARPNSEIAAVFLHTPQADQHDATSQARQEEYAIAALPHACWRGV